MTLTVRQLVGLVLVVSLLSSMTIFVAGVALLSYAVRQAETAEVAPGSGGGWVPSSAPAPASRPSFWEEQERRDQQRRIEELERQRRDLCFNNPSACR